MAKPARHRHADAKPCCVLALQGGGALGAYHIGAYQALAEYGFEPEWFSGISIGSINAAVLAGNPPERRLERLEELWELISRPQMFQRTGLVEVDLFLNSISNMNALALGQPHFFKPRPVNPFLAPAGLPSEASFYDTGPMIETLRRLCDFDLINDGPVRLTLGATNVETGEVEYFDSGYPKHKPITPEHVVASGSLPPGFAAVKIGEHYYWDGGCVSNSPVEAVIDDQPPGHTLVFMIDLWDAAGKAPTTMNEVLWRAKQIQYASRGHLLADTLAMKANLRHAERKAAAVAEGEIPAAAGRRRGGGEGDGGNHRTLDLMHIIYHPGPDQIPNSDAEFSRSSIKARREAGYVDMCELLARKPWHADAALEAKADVPAGGAVLHRVKAGRVFSHAAPGMGRPGHPRQ